MSVCGAVVLGSVWGVLGLRPLALVGALAPLVLAARRISGRRGTGTGPPTPLAGGPVVAPLWCVVLAGVAAWRGAASPAACALGGSVRGIEGAYLAEGRLALEGGDGRAGLVGVRETLALAPGSVDPGDWVGIVSAYGRVRAAQGPPPTPDGSVVPRAAAGRPWGADEVVVSELAADEVVRLAPAPEGPLAAGRRALARVRAAGLERARALPTPLARGLACALLFGDRSELAPEVVDTFTRTGTRHLLALSGLHVGLAAWLVAAPLAALAAQLVRALCGGHRRGPVRIEGLRAVAILAVVPLGGSGAPVTRAALALALASLAPRLPLARRLGSEGRTPGPGRRVDALSLWAAALVLECALDPRAPLRIGVQLSYAAVLGLLLSTSGLRALLLPRLADVDSLGHRRSPVWLAPARRALSVGTDALAASLAAVLATLPIAWLRFGEASPLGCIATALALPPLALLLVGGWAGVLLPALLPAATELPARALLGWLEAVDRLPSTPVPLPPRPTWLVGVASAAALFALSRRASARGRARAGRVAALGFGALLLPWAPAPRGLELVALDVGHGTAVVARGPGQRCWLFDAGSRERVGVATRAVAPLLRAWDVGGIDVVLSHSDRDHAGALPWIVERWRPRLWAGAPPDAALRHALDGTPILDLERGRLPLPGGRGHWLRAVLLRGEDAPGNEGSRALRLAIPGATILLSGDAEGAGLAALLRSGALDRPLRLLLFPHHGSDSPHAGELLAATTPEEVWVSSSSAPAVAAELERRGLRWRTTADEGWLTLRLEPAAQRAPRRVDR